MTRKAWAFGVGLLLWAAITWPHVAAQVWKVLPLVALGVYVWLFVSGRIITRSTRDRMNRENGR